MSEDAKPVRYKLSRESKLAFHYTLTVAPDSVTHPETGRTIEPLSVAVIMEPDIKGVWHLERVSVYGALLEDGKDTGMQRAVRWYLWGDEEPDALESMPSWLREIAESHVGLMNPQMLHERQQQAAREVVEGMLGGIFSGDLNTEFVNEVADKVLAAVRKVG